MSVDPGNAGADPSDPQTWNGYGYVRNSPLVYVDPSGENFLGDIWNGIRSLGNWFTGGGTQPTYSPWDYKQQGRTLSDLGCIQPSPYQEFGNFNFGVVGAAAVFLHRNYFGALDTRRNGREPPLLNGDIGTAPILPTETTLLIRRKFALASPITRMVRPVKTLLIVVLVAAAVVLIACNPCSKEVVQASLSPDGVLQATWYTKNCGATTDFSTVVSVHRPDDSSYDESDIVFVAKGKQNLKLTWAGPRRLLVECSSCERRVIFREVTKIGDIDVSFPGS
jgi:hypothetical protein